VQRRTASSSSRLVLMARSDERGLTSVGVLLAVGFTLIVAVIVVNLLLYLYGHSAARAAIDEGVRAGSRVAAGPAVCEARADEALEALMPGPLGDGVTINCAGAGNALVATADVTLSSPLPGIPSWSFQMQARAVQETGE
jgi:hypothetical protein